jgi:hypothetical protein
MHFEKIDQKNYEIQGREHDPLIAMRPPGFDKAARRLAADRQSTIDIDAGSPHSIRPICVVATDAMSLVPKGVTLGEGSTTSPVPILSRDINEGPRWRRRAGVEKSSGQPLRWRLRHVPTLLL